MPSKCWLCVHCDVAEVVEMMRFVEEKSTIMHIDVLATEIATALQTAHPDAATELTEEHIKQHVARHVVTPVASITRITRDLLDICETLRPSVQTLQNRKRRPERNTDERKQRKRGAAIEADTDNDSQACEDTDNKNCSEEEVGMYLRTVGQVMQIYRLHARMLQAPN